MQFFLYFWKFKKLKMKTYKIFIFAVCALALAACSTAQTADSPTETLRKFIEASKNKDVETVKKTLSKGSLELIEKTAKEQGTTVDELLRKDNGTPIKELPETRNEKIEGDTASVEVKNKVTGDFEIIPFVKEEGTWKIALDKFMQDIMKKMTEDMKMPDTNSLPDKNAQAPQDDSDKAAPNKK